MCKVPLTDRHTTTTNINFPRDARVVALPLYINKTAECVTCQVQSYHMLVLSEIVEHVNELKVTFTLLTNKCETLLAFSRVRFEAMMQSLWFLMPF